MMLSVYPEYLETTTSVEELPIQKRGCILPEKTELIKFKHYSYNNCVAECRHNYTLQLCGCSPFFLPRRGNSSFCNCAVAAIGFKILGAQDEISIFVFKKNI
ncbi:hypothetical protein L9F63_021445 [Diploptera punctata]|uniref:Uncharacterized protein n=1 Tax=Diploptera punctata TaxID=6984 RepID=A0AAD7ZP19_DIPPU|nr:hypothetical protein L9F63_021445 [Diploptera punctata]